MTGRPTAGVLSRLLAHALDCCVGLVSWVLCTTWLLIGLWALENSPRDLLDVMVIVLAVLALGMALHVAYHVVFVGGCGQTLGKMTLGIVVVRLDGGSVGYGRATLRCLGGLLAFACFGLGYAGVLFTAKRRGLADWLAGTCVVKVGVAPAAAGAAAPAGMSPLGA